MPPGSGQCANCGLLVGPPTAAPVPVGAASPWGRPPSGDGRGAGWSAEPPAFPPRLPLGESMPSGPPPYGAPTPEPSPPAPEGTSARMILVALGAAILVALVVVTVVVYATRPSTDVATTASSTTVATTVAPTTPPTTTARATTTTGSPAPTTSSSTPDSSTAPRPSTTARAGSTDDWVKFTPAGGGYSVEFPSKPKVDKLPSMKALPGADAGVVAVAMDGGAVYDVVSLDLGVRIPASSLDALASSFAGAVSPGVDVTDSRSTTVQGHPAVAFTASGTNGGRTVPEQGLMVANGTQVVALVAAGSSADSERFFGSLDLD